MAWTELTRRQHDREGGRYASDLTDAEWAVIEALMPPRRKTGRPRTTCLRDVVDAILYIATTGCQWRMLPRGVCQTSCPPISCSVSDFRGADFGFWIEPDGSGGLPVSGFA